MIIKGKIQVEGLLGGYEAILIQAGYSTTTRFLLIRRAEFIIRRHLNAGMVYFAWLEGQGFADLAGVGAIHIQRFLLFCSEYYALSTIHDVRLYLKKLYALPILMS